MHKTTPPSAPNGPLKETTVSIMPMNGYTSPALPPIDTSNSPFSADLNHYTPRRYSPSYSSCAGSSGQNYEFIHVSLLTNVKYEALSYAWGDLPANKTIKIDKTDYYVRDNLFAALEALRLRSRRRYLWVDAVCINQEDFDERNAQVALMSQIYAKADEVIVWLGKAGRDYWGAMTLLDSLGNSATSAKELSRSVTEHAAVSHVKFWTELSMLCHRPYWQRLWIIQEVVLASKIKAHCSSLIFDWERLDWTATSLYVGTSLAGGGDKGYFSLLQTLEAIRNMKHYATDQRDRFFGLYSLAKDCCTKATPADYRQTFFETISMVTLHHFRRHTDKLDVLQKYEHFRQTLARTMPNSIHIVQDFLDHNPDALEGQEIMKAVGNVRGSIVYISPPLKDLCLTDYLRGLDFLDLNATPLIEDQLRYFFHQRGGKGYFHNDRLHNIDDICNYGSREKCSFSAFYLKAAPRVEDIDLLASDVSSPRQKSLPPGKRDRIVNQLMSSFNQTLHEAKWKAEQSSNTTQVRLFLEENGMIGYVSDNAQVGDLIVQFRATSTAVVMRKEGDQGNIVGRVCDLLDRRSKHGKSRPFVCQDQDIDENGFDVPPQLICLRMKLSALRMFANGNIMYN
ncbi:uncharacterized protein EAF02_002359 [Botrytis sinoallii]|uniref:uncharacterized protein n=1 Tax=Botrytis sinoallii TaxID=1463999 RepID=UPI0019005B3F|nr:uncharacterized protein EAF02_002359 [Botrytis sinoallii]KAF7889944.1 hypothetical protein EAF02_002359 [Botrytis sinoallii]